MTGPGSGAECATAINAQPRRFQGDHGSTSLSQVQVDRLMKQLRASRGSRRPGGVGGGAEGVLGEQRGASAES